MQAWLAKVLVIKDSVEFVKWNEEKVLPYRRINDSIEFSKQSLIALFSFPWINIHEYFSFQTVLYREYILSCNDLLSFWVTSIQFNFFRPSRTTWNFFVWKDNNQYFKFYSISPLGRYEINVWKTQINFKTIYLLLKIKSSHWFEFN